MSNRHGCCADKACNSSTCMELPAGKTCGDCRSLPRCAAFIGRKGTETSCDWFPRAFVEEKLSPGMTCGAKSIHGVRAMRASLPWDAQPGCFSCGRRVNGPCTNAEGCEHSPVPAGVDLTTLDTARMGNEALAKVAGECPGCGSRGRDHLPRCTAAGVKGTDHG